LHSNAEVSLSRIYCNTICLWLEQVRQHGYLFRLFCDNFEQERLRNYLAVMENNNMITMLKDKAMVVRS
jgi:hypothetical protein